MSFAADPKWYRAGLIELHRRLPETAWTQFNALRATLDKCLDMQARFGRLSSDLDFDYQVTLSELDTLSQSHLGLSFTQLCQRLYDWANAAFHSVVPGHVAQPDRAVAFALPGSAIDSRSPWQLEFSQVGAGQWGLPFAFTGGDTNITATVSVINAPQRAPVDV